MLTIELVVWVFITLSMTSFDLYRFRRSPATNFTERSTMQYGRWRWPCGSSSSTTAASKKRKKICPWPISTTLAKIWPNN